MKPDQNFAYKNKTINDYSAVLGNKNFQGILLIVILALFIFFLSALANIVCKGLGGIVKSIASKEIQFAIKLSLLASITSTLICLLFAVPVAYGLERLCTMVSWSR